MITTKFLPDFVNASPKLDFICWGFESDIKMPPKKQISAHGNADI